MTLHDVMILINSVFNNDQNNYYYNMFLEKCSYQLAKKCWQKFFWWYDNIEVWQGKGSKKKFYGAYVNIDNLVSFKVSWNKN